LLLQSTLTAFEKLKPETVNTFADDVARLRAEFPVPAVDGIAV
jgi:hypothetical protein